MPRSEDEILGKIKYLLGIMNPIRLESLASQLGMDLTFLKEFLLRAIEKKQLSVFFENYVYVKNTSTFYHLFTYHKNKNQH